MSKIYKYRLLKDLPEYPKNCVFVLNDNGWRGYWNGGDWTIPAWIEQLLSERVVPEVRDEYTDWFEPIVDGTTMLYDVDIRGKVKERTVYDFWGGWESKYTFTDKAIAEEKAAQIREIFMEPTPSGGEGEEGEEGEE